MSAYSEVPSITSQKRGDIVREKVDLPLNTLGLAGCKAPNAKVAVKASDYALKELLIRLPGRGKQHPVVLAEAADQAV
jgi:hypothetical protein